MALKKQNSSLSAGRHMNVGRSGGQYPWSRARSSSELMRCRSDALVRPRHALAAYVRRAKTVARSTRRVPRLCTRRHQPLDVLTDREVITDAHAQHLHTCAARYSRQRCRLCSCVSSPAVSENDLCGLAAVQFQVVLLGPSLHVVKFREPRRLATGGDDDVGVVGKFAQRVSRHDGDDVSSSDDVRSRSDG